jgi:AraC family transcriptional regulator of adaptative response / DNA-3-methyladenine glycosylase II
MADLLRQPKRAVVLRLPFTAPCDWESMLAFIGTRAIPGVESVDDGMYRRSIAIRGAVAGLEVHRPPGEDCLCVRVVSSAARDGTRIIERLRALFDLDCDPHAVAQRFSRDKRLAACVRRHPGLRVPGSWDPFEMAIRAILGQQVSVRGACTLAGRLVQSFGEPAHVNLPGVTHRFPPPARLASVDLRGIGLPSARAAAIRQFALAIAEGRLVLDATRELEATIAALVELPGIGPWTAHYIAMRALRQSDAFPAGDLGVRKALARNGAYPTARDVERIAERWRPYRAYAVMHLWKGLS